MFYSTLRRHALSVAAIALTTLAAAPGLHAQAAPTSDADRHFLHEIGQDSNFEIKTGELALERSHSADVKQYARMVIHDHTALKVQIKAADRAASVEPVGPDSMMDQDQSMYSKLKGLSGKEFDQAYIEELIKGNESSVNEAKSEATGSAVPPVKALAQHTVALDSKHTRAAKQLAAAHHVQAQG